MPYIKPNLLRLNLERLCRKPAASIAFNTCLQIQLDSVTACGSNKQKTEKNHDP